MKNLEKEKITDKKAIKEAQKIIENSSKNADSIKNANLNKDANPSQNTNPNKDANTNKNANLNKNTNPNKDANLNKNANPNKDTNSKKKKKDTSLPVPNKKGKKIILLIIIFIILIILVLLSTIFGIITNNSNKIISGVSVNGINISNLTKDEAYDKLNLYFSSSIQKEITLTRGDYSTKINPSSLQTTIDLNSAIDQAYNIGRSEGNIFANNFKVISTHFNNENIIPTLNYNKELLNETINTINTEIPDGVVDSSYKIENNNLIISNSCNGYRIQNNLLENNIKTAILNNNINALEIPVEQFEAESINIEAIYNQIHKDAVDASYSTNPYQIQKEQEGLDFAITLDEAKKLIEQEQETYTIPLKTLKPKVTVKSLPQEAFPDLLATYSTTYASSNVSRSTNISLATKSINNFILMPDETFSYNGTVGQRTAARGYKEAGVYVNGEVTTGLGGGICQVSSTLYNSVLLSNLEVVARSNHTFEPSYVPAGQDATVSWGAPDFKFKNNRNYPVKIVATASSGKITVNIYGLKTSDDYQVKIQSSKIGSIPYTTNYKDDPSLPVGTEKVTQNGSNGCKSQTYKILYKNGVEVSRTLISTDTYKPHNKVVLRGTKVVQTPAVTPKPPVQTPTETPQNTTPSITITNQPAA